jgi:hypothetical protein
LINALEANRDGGKKNKKKVAQSSLVIAMDFFSTK